MSLACIALIVCAAPFITLALMVVASEIANRIEYRDFD